jgi:hypothetical protein
VKYVDAGVDPVRRCLIDARFLDESLDAFAVEVDDAVLGGVIDECDSERSDTF